MMSKLNFFHFFGLDFAIFKTEQVKKITLQLHVIDHKRNVTFILLLLYFFSPLLHKWLLKFRIHSFLGS